MWQANLGRLEPAGNSATLVADIAEAEADDWLRSLAGLAKAWIALGSNRHQDALAALQPIRGVGFDLHQHQMVEIYLALSHYRLRNWREAAEAMLDAIENSVRTRNLRSQAAAMEAGAYLAMHKDRPEVSARLLGKANDIRERTRLPLFSFWLATHEEAMSLVPQQVGRETFSALYADGAQAREELVVEETRELLREVAGDQAVLRAPMSD
jgi:hypothetical protein